MMKKYARIDAGRVVEFFETDGDMAELFHPEIVWIDVTALADLPAIGWLYDGAAFASHLEQSLDELRATKREGIKAERDRRIQHGGYKVGEKWFHSDTFSRTQQMGLVMLGANVPAGLQWKTMDGTFVAMTQALAGQVFAAASASDVAIFGVSEAKRTAMEASADPAAYDVAVGWSLAFGE